VKCRNPLFSSILLKYKTQGVGMERQTVIRKATDYSAMYAVLDSLMAAELPQMDLYCEIGRHVCGRPERGAAAAAAAYLQKVYPDASGFSPRNLRRMRDFYKLYGSRSDLLELAMQVGWTQNIVILEADLTINERAWYLQAATQLSWSKSELIDQISASAYLFLSLDERESEPNQPEGAEYEKHQAFVSIFKKSKNYCKPWMLSGFRRSHSLFFNRFLVWPVLQSIQYQ